MPSRWDRSESAPSTRRQSSSSSASARRPRSRRWARPPSLRRAWSGACTPKQGGIVLSFERMGKILEVDGGDLVATVEPGVLLSDLHARVESERLFYPPDPASVAIGCTLGGNVAECAGGPRAFKYG